MCKSTRSMTKLKSFLNGAVLLGPTISGWSDRVRLGCLGVFVSVGRKPFLVRLFDQRFEPNTEHS